MSEERIARLEHNYASLQKAFDETKTLAAQRLEALKEAKRQRDELLAALEFARAKIEALHIDNGDGDCYYPIIDDAIAAAAKEQGK